MRRIVSSLSVTLLFLGLFILAFSFPLAKAQSGGTIIINPDGSISSPVTVNITTSDKITYTFNGSNYLPIVVNRSNVIINGMGYTLQASGERGFYVEYPVHDVTIKNTTITNSDLGIDLNGSYNDTLSDNYVTANTNYGIGVHYAYSSGGITLSGNNVTENGYDGIYVEWSNSCILTGNKVTANGNEGIDVVSFSDNNILSGNNVTANSFDGVDLYSSSNNTLFGNTVTANSEYGFYLESSSGNVLSDNNVTGNPNGIHLYSSPDNTFSGNTIANSVYGVITYYSDNNTLSGNNLTANTARGVALYSSSDNNTLSGNNIANSAVGVELYNSSDNIFYHNNFDNAQQAYSNGSPNTWDNGYPSGGNYWSDYAGVDHYHGSGQNVAGGDGIGDANYTIAASNVDRYPLKAPFKTFSVGTWNGTAYSVDTVSNSTITNVSFNSTRAMLTFNVTGTSGTVGFCRVAIPANLMWISSEGQWTVIVGGTLYDNETIIQSGNYTYIYFTYHHSTQTVQIQSTSALPEYQPVMLMSTLMTFALIGAAVSKRKLDRTPAWD